MSEPAVIEPIRHPGGGIPALPDGLRGARSRTAKEAAIGGLLFGAGAVSILTTVGIIAVLVWESLGFFRRVPVAEGGADGRHEHALLPGRGGDQPFIGPEPQRRCGVAAPRCVRLERQLQARRGPRCAEEP